MNPNETALGEPLLRSLLFAPANRPDLVLKFPRAAADCSVIDLEDGTALAEKQAARADLRNLVEQVRAAGLSGPLGVRVNAPDSPFFAEDVAAAVTCAPDVILLPKAEAVEDVLRLAAAIQAGGREIAVFAGIETAAGVLHAPQICACTRVLQAVFFGAEDLAADIGAQRTDRGDEVLAARSMVLLAARASRILAIDQAVVDIRDDERFLRDCAASRNLGYDGKTCLTPRQTALANQAFSPSAKELDYAQRLVAAYEAARARGLGAFDFEGRMIDTPLLRRAERLLRTQSTLGRSSPA
ncbi:CoA ester lyase [Verticiella sediminum]|uniref:CoA ester lyase n=1 Tax=Verticiella sediminum TaxID=1247510 RepID=A0A556AZK6_9BURK|nr:CoA ester lyase [Verticiella sediminum]TSH98358.1 CoA ester lyase [Verticiella sediminum]